ncbi:MAG: RibD family protein [Halieaceae bacterium]|jgi:riboflavin-specific deaminase-like protein|nr:RibD family protein [Halieaceae bacterium]
MHVDVTPAVWRRLLAVRRGEACCCCGQWSSGERAALDLYGPLARRDLGPSVVAQVGQSLDGRVATASGDARDVSGPDGLAHLHRMRALADAVVIGVRTALQDLPRLTVRLCEGDNPARVVIDPKGRLPDEAPLLADDGSRRIVIQAVDRVRAYGVRTIRLHPRDGHIEPAEIIAALRDEGLHNLLVEGGGITIARFIDEGLLTRMQLAIAPLLIGDGPQGLTLGNSAQRLADAIRPDTRAYSLGSDVVFDCGLSESAALATQPLHSLH